MKETILSKFKRLAVAMFVALCVGSVWAEIKLDIKDLDIDANGTLSFSYQLHYWNTSSVRYPYLSAELLDVNSNVLKTKEIIPAASSTTPLTNEGAWEWKTATLEECGIASKEAFFDGLYTLRVTFKAFKTGQAQSEWDVDITGFDPSGIISCLSDWELKPSKMFVISGTYDASIGIESAFITYSINDQSMANPQTAAVTLNEDGTFVCNIPFTNVNDVLTYKLTVVRGGVNIAYNGGTKFTVELTEGRITYTWIGNTETSSNNYWKNLENWDFEDGSKYGYPGESSGGYYVAVANFTKNADVDLNGEAVYLLDNNRGFEMSEGITVKLKNGTLGFQPHNDGNPVTLNLGKKNSTLHLKDVEMPYNNEKIYDKTKGRYKEYDVMLVADSTVIVEGNQEYIWRFYPGNARTKFKVANGIMQMKHRKKQPGADSEVEISNAVWVLSTCIQTAEGFPIESCQYGLAMKTIFRDGPDRQAQLIFREKHTSGMYYNLKLVGMYDFKPSNKTKATYTVAPYLIAGGLSAGDACTISVDVSDLEGRARIPLMKFTSGGDNVTTAMNTMVTDESKLIVTANGRNVKSRQRAKLVWDESAKTLYYEQDPIKGFRVIVR